MIRISHSSSAWSFSLTDFFVKQTIKDKVVVKRNECFKEACLKAPLNPTLLPQSSHYENVSMKLPSLLAL